jgi:uncharacterized protein (TIGR02147 family)
MWIIEFSNYKSFLRAKIKTYPGKGRGQAARLAKHLNISQMGVSLILNGERHFTQSQALETSMLFGLTPRETDCFVCMVNLERADTSNLKKYYQDKLDQIRDEEKNIKNLIHTQGELSDKDKGIFYSNWYYCGVWLLVFIKGYQNAESIAEYFGLSPIRVGEITAFLLRTGICAEKDGMLTPGKTAIHVNKKSDFVSNHWRNWRDKAREKVTRPDEDDIFYSSPVSISKKDAETFRRELLKMIQSFSKAVADSPAQELVCLNVDFFKF